MQHGEYAGLAGSSSSSSLLPERIPIVEARGDKQVFVFELVSLSRHQLLCNESPLLTDSARRMAKGSGQLRVETCSVREQHGTFAAGMSQNGCVIGTLLH